ncbi:serine carboxypeptidase-like 17 isoform X1 [Ricinus communis]|uniref:serine carboxypeptidase-like 17 isoform X1 n=1 Tax=Ricinus communis TaxID=3988 RepID=UPI0007729AF4|nr:serine carboxypeptidase-like 17 isoform X1 [Ricinus communis]|eukprot:XP_015578548.1 serine carboxypeptidase-like 17 isoform X1 [Ricinus communis]
MIDNPVFELKLSRTSIRMGAIISNQKTIQFCKNYQQLVYIHMTLTVVFLFKAAASFSIIRTLPGFSGSVPFKLETGYIGVDEKEDVQLFYYFIESERNAREDPLVLWLTGGPGCSALSGLAFEIGPLLFNMVEYNGSLPTLKLNPYSWTKVSSVIFLDAPVGTGFSYSRSFQGSKTADTIYATQTSTFLKKWLLCHPQFIKIPLYIAGDSYSGIIVPIITKELSEGIELGEQPQINLEGYLLGNPGTDSKFDGNSKIPFAHRMAIISDELYKSAKRNCKGEYVKVNPNNTKCLDDLEAISKCTSRIKKSHILEPQCSTTFRALNKIYGVRRYLLQNNKDFLLLPPGFPHYGCRGYNSVLCNIWANDASVQRALHAWKGNLRKWIRCNESLYYIHDVQSTLGHHLYLNERGYRALIYSGDHDMVIPYLGTLSWIKALNISILEQWHPWMVDGQVAGYSMEFSNHFTFATVKGAGHTAPEYKPRECFAMFKRWISGQHL